MGFSFFLFFIAEHNPFPIFRIFLKAFSFSLRGQTASFIFFPALKLDWNCEYPVIFIYFFNMCYFY